MAKVNLFWFRRDLRLHDNAALYHALRSGLPVVPVFIFDRKILDLLDEKADARVTFIHEAIIAIQDTLLTAGSTMDVHYGNPDEVFQTLITKYEVQDVFTNHDYEPYARERDTTIEAILKKSQVGFK